MSIYNFLVALSKEYIAIPNKTLEISNAEVDRYLNAQYKVVTVIPYADNPVKNVRILNQQELDELLDGYNDYAEFIIEISLIAI